jgi:hypothetical protein
LTETRKAEGESRKPKKLESGVGLDHIAEQVKASLGVQIEALKEVGMEDTEYFHSLQDFFKNRDINDSKDSYKI